EGRTFLALWRDQHLWDLNPLTLDALLRLPLDGIRAGLGAITGPELDPVQVEIAAPAESQEVWAAGVTYLRSREARVEETTQKTIYEQVYESDRPELFFKAAGWRVVADGGEIGVREDSTWDVPEPELAVLSNAHGEVVAFACGNDRQRRADRDRRARRAHQPRVARKTQRRAGETDTTREALASAAVGETQLFPPEQLFEFSVRVFEHFGVPEDDARTAATVLQAADLRGIDSHGVARLHTYFDMLQLGRIDPKPSVTIVRESPSTATVDGGNGLGLVVGPKADAIALQQADAGG